jgi:mRNA interferase RelE/StbE
MRAARNWASDVAHTVIIERSALRDLKNVPHPVRERIDRHIQALAVAPRPQGVEKLAGSDCSYRIRVGDYRILYEIHDERLHVLVVKVGHRREAYRRK